MKGLCLPPQTLRAPVSSCDSGMGVTLAVSCEVVPAPWVQWAVLMLTAGFNTCKDGMI